MSAAGPGWGVLRDACGKVQLTKALLSRLTHIGCVGGVLEVKGEVCVGKRLDSPLGATRAQRTTFDEALGVHAALSACSLEVMFGGGVGS